MGGRTCAPFLLDRSLKSLSCAHLRPQLPNIGQEKRWRPKYPPLQGVWPTAGDAISVWYACPSGPQMAYDSAWLLQLCTFKSSGCSTKVLPLLLLVMPLL